MNFDKSIIRMVIFAGIPILVLSVLVIMFLVGNITNNKPANVTTDTGSQTDRELSLGGASGVSGVQSPSGSTDQQALDEWQDYVDQVVLGKEQEIYDYKSQVGSQEYLDSLEEKMDEIFGDFPKPGDSTYGDDIYARVERLRSEMEAEVEAATFGYYENLPSVSLSGYSSCGGIPVPPGANTDAVIDFMIHQESIQCLGISYMDGCNPTTIGGAYITNAYGGCKAGSPYVVGNVNVEIINFCAFTPSANLIALAREYEVKVDETVEDIAETFIELNNTIDALAAARAALAAAEADLAEAIDAEAAESEIDALRARVAALRAEVASLEARVIELEALLEEYEELRDETYGLIGITMSSSDKECVTFKVQ